MSEHEHPAAVPVGDERPRWVVAEINGERVLRWTDRDDPNQITRDEFDTTGGFGAEWDGLCDAVATANAAPTESVLRDQLDAAVKVISDSLLLLRELAQREEIAFGQPTMETKHAIAASTALLASVEGEHGPARPVSDGGQPQ